MTSAFLDNCSYGYVLPCNIRQFSLMCPHLVKYLSTDLPSNNNIYFHVIINVTKNGICKVEIEYNSDIKFHLSFCEFKDININ